MLILRLLISCTDSLHEDYDHLLLGQILIYVNIKHINERNTTAGIPFINMTFSLSVQNASVRSVQSILKAYDVKEMKIEHQE